ncbi:aspartate aminotransferase family protein [Elongatibacter sediminis]|uniref:Acetylornithine aminotransferase n=1 Tax=Elongatibacter sediminis TaxID=3119006 RepID=A0AAW9RBH4_9GAMM
MSEHLMNTYARMPVAMERGEGAWLWDSEGNRYLDAVSGLGVTALGHAHPRVTETIADQAGKLIHTANLFQIPWQEALADRLADVSGLDRAFVCNSGTEAVECALKIIRLAGHERGIDTPGVIVMDGSFHGRTLAALSATGSRKAQAGFEPLVSGFVRVPFNDIDAIEKVADRDPSITAVLVEPIQGEAGIQVPDADYLGRLRSICNRRGWLLACDEIQSGLCRSGHWYAHQHEDVVPDILTTAKALANGLPIGACLARGAAAELLSPGRHGSTFGGNPLVCRTACTVLDVMREEGLADRAAQLGERILTGFREALGGLPLVTDIRGRGLMIGIELDRPATALKDQALEQGLVINVTREKVIRLLPPLILEEPEADRIVETVSGLVRGLAD